MLRKDNQIKLSEFGNLYDLVVPKNNLLRKIKENIDFSFVNPLLKKQYCEAFGRPAKEPEMMFKIMFLKRLYDLSDEVLVDNLGYNMAFKYFIGLDPEDHTIDPSLLTKFRKTRITEDILEEMLAETIRQAIEKGLLKSRSIIVDSTHSASKGNPETPTQILRRLSKALRKEIYQTQPDLAEQFPDKPAETATLEEEIAYTQELVTAVAERLEHKTPQKLLARITELLEDEKIKRVQSASDEDASVGHKSADSSFFGYKSHLAMTDERLICAVEVTTGRSADTKELPSLIEKSEASGVQVEEVLGDKAYSSQDNIDYCEGKNIKLLSRLNTVVSNGKHRDDEFVYNKDAACFQCPEGHLATRCDVTDGKFKNQHYRYSFSMKTCRKCPRYQTCCKPGMKTKTYTITIRGGSRQKQYEFEQTEYFGRRIKDRYKIEAKNAELKQSHGFAKCKYVGLRGMAIQAYFTAFVANVKRIVKLQALETV